MGCDGSGKTTLASAIAASHADIEGVLTGKHLYRKSWLYKLLVIFVRPLLLQDREHFDETFAPVAYLRACIGLRLKLWRRTRGVLLMDRSLADFLYVGRKTESPQFCRSLWLSRVIGRRIPVVHFILPFERVRERKQEMTRAGHAAYDAAMFRHFTQRAPTDYVAFNNAGAVTPGAEALGRILQRLSV
jgi:thymidylate kinase